MATASLRRKSRIYQRINRNTFVETEGYQPLQTVLENETLTGGGGAGRQEEREGKRRGENAGTCTPYEFHARDVNNRYVSYVCSVN